MKNIIKRIICVAIIILLTGCGTSSCERRWLQERALNYFSNKYDIKKSKIKVIKNDLRDQDEHCYFACDDNALYIEYEGKKYTIKYNSDDNNYEYFADDYQAEEIKNDILEYLSSEYEYISYLSIDIAFLKDDVLRIPEKYTGNFKTYLGQNRTLDNYNPQVNARIEIWIQAQNKEEAKELYEKSAKLAKELFNFPIEASICIAKEKCKFAYGDTYFYFRSTDPRNYYNCKKYNIDCPSYY